MTPEMDSLTKLGGTALALAVLLYMLRFFMTKLDKKDEDAKEAAKEAKTTAEKKDAVIASLIERQAGQSVAMMGMMERMADALERIERRLEHDSGLERSNPGIRAGT